MSRDTRSGAFEAGLFRGPARLRPLIRLLRVLPVWAGTSTLAAVAVGDGVAAAVGDAVAANVAAGVAVGPPGVGVAPPPTLHCERSNALVSARGSSSARHASASAPRGISSAAIAQVVSSTRRRARQSASPPTSTSVAGGSSAAQRPASTS